MSSEERQALVASRGGYKSKFTRVKNTVQKYEKDDSLLTLPSAFAEIDRNLDLMPALRNNIEKISERIIYLTVGAEEQKVEEESLQALLDEFDIYDEKLIELRIQAKAKAPSSDSVEGMLSYINTKLDEQQIQHEVEKRMAEERFKMTLEFEQKKYEATLNLLVTENQSFITSSPHTRDAPSHAKLEPLTVPDFSGKYTEWTSFKELFLAIIDRNTTLTDAHKYYYLMKHLKDEAKMVVENIPASANIYSVAWKILMDKYDDKMSIAMSHIRSFLSIQKMSEPSADAMRRTHVTMDSAVQALDALDMKNRDIWLIYIALEKLDPESKTLWSRRCYNKIPTWQEFVDFLNERYKTMEMANPDKPSSSKRQEVKSKPKSALSVTTSSDHEYSDNATPGNLCASCGKPNHRTVKCYKFRGLKDTQRLEIVQRAKLCVNCLDPGHPVESCKSSACKQCGEKHSTWLHLAFHPNAQIPQTTTVATVHPDPPSPAPVTTDAEQLFGSATRFTLKCTTTSSFPTVLLATAVICVRNDEGEQILCRAVLDSGSQANIITEKISQMLKLPRRKTTCTLEGVGGHEAPSKYQTSLSFGPRGFNRWTETDCIIQEKITGIQPSTKIPTDSLPIPPKLVMADPQWNKPQVIDMLIGGQHYWDLVMDQTIRLGPGLPILKRSVFGWLVVGEISSIPASTKVCNLTTLESIDLSLKRFWEIEDVTGPAKQRKEEDEEAEKFFSDTVTRDPDTGRFIVHLPFTDKVKELENNYSNAAKQLYFLQKTLQNTPGMSDKYQEVFDEYDQLHITETVPKEEQSKKAFYLPHHGVYKESSTTTKLRVVFNASSKGKSNVSLNDTLLTGPVVQPPLIEILWRFRQHRYALTGDITKMYLQFLVTPEHRDFHRFLWRNLHTGELEHRRFRTVVFGVACSPYLATRSLVQLAVEDGDKFPEAQRAVVSSFYVDDCLISAQTIKELQEVKDQLSNLLQCASLQLSKWTSNAPELCGNETIKDVGANQEAASEPVKALGLYWDPTTDEFSFRVSCDIDGIPTKRQLLSIIARLFDPMGALGPIVVNAKCLMQTLWKLQCDWDAPLPESVVDEWLSFLESLRNIPKLRIPRYVSEFSEVARWEVHVFTDASKRAYGATVYIVTEDSSGNRYSCLLTAKSRVAPVKLATIPKLELNAAELGSRLVKSVRESLKCTDYFCWTDATVVLCQIRSPNNREAFVKNRLKIILEHTSAEKWHHVPTAQNPADLISRGTSAEFLSQSSLWWNGPNWLLDSPDKWPSQEIVPEQKSTLAVTIQWPTPREYLLNRSNSFSFIRRVMAWVKRFITIFKNKYGRPSLHTQPPFAGPLQAVEIKQAEVTLVKLEQLEFLAEDIKTLSGQTQKELSKPLRHLGTFLDSDGLIRASGRLDNADLEEDVKKPVIFPSGPLAKRLVYHIHHQLAHAGPTHMLAEIRKRYWPLFGRRVLQNTHKGCVLCSKRKPHPCQQQMGPLPSPRVNFTRPFESVGIDFAGPILIKANRLRRSPTIKTYVAVYVCLAVKALHLEIVSELSTEAFLASFRRFVARRGTPKIIYSDNGTNFVGAANVLGKFLSETANQTAIIDATSGDGITWQFMPPRSPHWGGLWEAAVKALKYHFTRVIGPTILTYEELATVVTQIEGVLNSRPLTAIPNTTPEPTILTPAHFLLTAPITGLPEWNMTEIPHLNRWQVTQKIYQDLSARWKREYLVSLQRRTKWTKEITNIQPGDVVLLLNECTPGTSWPLAVVTQVHPGQDGKVRLITVRTMKGSYQRTVQNVARLPIATQDTKSEENASFFPGECVGANTRKGANLVERQRSSVVSSENSTE